MILRNLSIENNPDIIQLKKKSKQFSRIIVYSNKHITGPYEYNILEFIIF